MYLCTNLKLTVWHNWFNWVRTAWSCKTYKQFVANFGATTGVIYIRSFPNFFRPSSSSCRANGANITLSSRFLYLAYIVWLFDPLFSLVYFSVSPPNSPAVLAKCATMPDKRQRDNTRALAFIRWDDWENNCFVLKVTRFFCFCSWCEAMFCNMIPHWGECHFSRFISFSSG